MADTALDLITDALLDLGVVADGETPSASQANGGLRKLNNLIDAWNIQNLLVGGATQNVFPLTSNQSTYTMGTGGNFNIARPNNVLSAYIRDITLTATQRMDIPVNLYTIQEYADYPFKGQTIAQPFGVYIDDAYPLITVTVIPTPTTGNFSLVLWTEGIIGNLTLQTVISLAPGYKRALTANLVIELAPGYRQQVTAETVQIASTSKADLKTQNFQLNETYIDPVLSGNMGYDIVTNRYWGK